MSETVYIFGLQFTAITVPTIDNPADAARRLSLMVGRQHHPDPDTIIATDFGGASTAFLLANQDAEILDTHSINNSMRIEAISRITGADRYYVVDTHAQGGEAALVILPYTFRSGYLHSENTGDILPAFIEQHGRNDDKIVTLPHLDGTKRLLRTLDLPTYVETIDVALTSENIDSHRKARLTDFKATMVWMGEL